jgi:hypothetical protein
MQFSKEFIEAMKLTKAQPDDPIFQEGPQMFSVPPGWNEKHNKWKREKAAEEMRKKEAADDRRAERTDQQCR